MIWIFGLVTGLIFDLPLSYWIIGFLVAVIDTIIQDTPCGECN